jgi:hypothetical protein
VRTAALQGEDDELDLDGTLTGDDLGRIARDRR